MQKKMPDQIVLCGVPEWLVKAIDEVAEREFRSRSACALLRLIKAFNGKRAEAAKGGGGNRTRSQLGQLAAA